MYTYKIDGEIQDLELDSELDCLDYADSRIRDFDPDFYGDQEIELIKFRYDDSGERVILDSRIQWLRVEKSFDPFREYAPRVI